MKRMDRYLVNAVFWPFLAAQAVFVVMFIGTEALTEATKLIARYGLPWPDVMEMILLRIPWAIGWTMPMSVGMAVVMAVGRLCKDHEYAPIVVGGMSFRRMLLPMLAFSLALSGLALWVQEWAGPYTMQRYFIRKMQVQARASAEQFEVHMRLSSYEDKRRVTLAAHSLDPKTRALEQVTIEVWEPGMLPSEVIHARSAHWHTKEQQWTLEDGVAVWYDGNGVVKLTSHFIETTVKKLAGVSQYGGAIVFEDSPNQIGVESSDKPDYMTYRDIRQRVAFMVADKSPVREINRVKIFKYRRWTLASSCILFLLVGASLAVSTDREANLGTAFGKGVALLLIYYIIWNAMSFMGEGSRWPWAWAWSTNVAGMIGGYFLYRRVPN